MVGQDGSVSAAEMLAVQSGYTLTRLGLDTLTILAQTGPVADAEPLASQSGVTLSLLGLDTLSMAEQTDSVADADLLASLFGVTLSLPELGTLSVTEPAAVSDKGQLSFHSGVTLTLLFPRVRKGSRFFRLNSRHNFFIRE